LSPSAGVLVASNALYRNSPAVSNPIGPRFVEVVVDAFDGQMLIVFVELLMLEAVYGVTVNCSPLAVVATTPVTEAVLEGAR
jgi:hypothetical protein